MKTINNKVTSIRFSDVPKDKPIDFKFLISMVLQDSIPKEGLIIKEQRKIFRVLDALDAEKNGKIVFEDADFEYMKDKVEKYGFRFTHRDLDKLLKEIEEAK